MKRMQQLMKAARGAVPADLVLKGGRIVNVFSGRIEQADVAIQDGVIVGVGRYSGKEEVDVSRYHLTPGFIDAHIHLESTMLHPAEFCRAVLPRGTTAVVADPHEIANVLGLPGIRFMLEATAGLPVDTFLMAPSCVPATHMETSGAELKASDLAELLSEPRVIGLAEVMNFPGVIQGMPEVLEKIERFSARPVDGHAPLVSGKDLCGYVLAGIGTDHECTTLEEGREKLARGMRILIREGSQAKNLAALWPLADDFGLRRVAFCTDDRHPDDLNEQGHLDHILRQAVGLGLDPVRAVVMATLNAAEAFGLKRRGALAPGYRADIAVLESLESMKVVRVFKDGRLAAADGQPTMPVRMTPIPEWAGPMHVGTLTRDALDVSVTGPRARVIEIVEGQLLTNHLVVEAPNRNGLLVADPDRDLARLMVVERHRGTGNVGHGLVKGFGLRQGALASSVAHDSHNIVAVGMSAEELLLAVETVRRMRGGQAVVCGDKVLAELPLPLAGLMSAASLEQTVESVGRIRNATRDLGCRLGDPFMILSFLSLPVIPSLKLTDRGLVDVERFQFTPLFVD